MSSWNSATAKIQETKFRFLSEEKLIFAKRKRTVSFIHSGRAICLSVETYSKAQHLQKKNLRWRIPNYQKTIWSTTSYGILSKLSFNADPMCQLLQKKIDWKQVKALNWSQNKPSVLNWNIRRNYMMTVLKYKYICCVKMIIGWT